MLHVIAPGTIVANSACYGAVLGKPVVYPDGYTIQRPVLAPSANIVRVEFPYKNSAVAPLPEPYFIATIVITPSDAADGRVSPFFTVLRSDNPSAKAYTSNKTANAVWREAIMDAAKDFPDRKHLLPGSFDSKGSLQLRGIGLYGLHLKEVQEELQRLPGASAAFAASVAAAVSATTEHTQPSPPTSQLSQPVVEARHGGDETVTDGASPSTHAAAKPKRVPKASATKTAAAPAVSQRGDVDVTMTGNSAAAANAATAAPKRSRRAAANSTGKSESKPPSSSAAAAAAAVTVVPCPDCGLAGTPFCAATGKPHEAPPCPMCGLRSAFCPVSGQPHAGAAQRENRRRGEVHLPGATRRPRRRAVGAVKTEEDAAGDVTEVTVVGTQGVEVEEGGAVGAAPKEKKPRRKRAHTADAAAVAAEDVDDNVVLADVVAVMAGSDVDGKPKRPRRVRKTESSANGAKGASAAAPPSITPQTTEMPAAEPVKETVYKYPPLRPPLTTREHARALQLLQDSWRVQYGDGPVLPAAVAAVPLAPVPAKRPGGAAAAATAGGSSAKSRRKGRSMKAEEEHGEKGKDSENEDKELSHAADSEEGAPHKEPADKPAKTEAMSEENREDSTAPLAAPVAMPTMVHPLEVTQLSSSVAGKRLVRFLLQYVSERTQYDVLRNSSNSADGLAEKGGSGGKQRSGKHVAAPRKSGEAREEATTAEKGGEAASLSRGADEQNGGKQDELDEAAVQHDDGEPAEEVRADDEGEEADMDAENGEPADAVGVRGRVSPLE